MRLINEGLPGYTRLTSTKGLKIGNNLFIWPVYNLKTAVSSVIIEIENDAIVKMGFPNGVCKKFLITEFCISSKMVGRKAYNHPLTSMFLPDKQIKLPAKKRKISKLP